MTAQANPVSTLIESARQRRLFVLAVEQVAIACTLVFAGVILLLLLGTQILSWYWLLLLAAIGIGIAAYRIRQRLPNHYRVAQFLDHRLELHDSLSTAWFLLSRPEGEGHSNARFQLEYAESLARGVDPTYAFPLTGQRPWALAGGVAAVAFGLFAVRYLVTDSLSLQRALIPMQLAEVFERVKKPPMAQHPPAPDSTGAEHRDAAPPQNDAAKNAEQEHLNGEGLKTGKAESVETAKLPVPPSGGHADGDRPQDGKSDNQEGAPSPGQKRPGDKNGPQNGQEGGAQQSSTPPPAGESDAKQQNSNQQSASVMDRMKDALSSMLAKMRPNANGQKSQTQQGQRSSEDQKSGEQSAGNKDQNGEPQKEGRDEQSSQQQSSEGQAQGQTTEKAQSAQGRSSGESADKNSADAHSGVGRQDGDKSVSEKEQLKAMGKLAEIIGKRSANLTGDILVENPSGKQQLKTGYSQRVGTHADLGGEINRDEIPLADRQYVREYMEEIRKTAKK